MWDHTRRVSIYFSIQHVSVSSLFRSILQSTTSIIVGPIIGLVYYWKLALVGIATMPFIVSSGYVRLVRKKQFHAPFYTSSDNIHSG